ncbi:MAG TPA: aldo/keto reductase [Actinomycetes bacterium]|nr:aldo/keto reductase [Actinomycetes bacterium]
METRRLGRLGHQSSVLIFGAAALAEVPQEVADRAVQEALTAGINHFDVARSYGEAEVRLGRAFGSMRGGFADVFLATKTGERRAEDAWREVNESLERLGTERVDLLQLHAVGDVEDLDRVTGRGGALEAALRAQEQGLVGAVGITGHGHDAPATHLEALRRHPFATVLTPINPVLSDDPAYRSAFDALVEEVQRQDAGLMLIKTVARQNWPDASADHPFTTWYEPLADQASVTAAVSWALSLPVATGIATPGDVRLLPLVVEAERHRVDPGAATTVLAADPAYSSPFLDMPI